MNATLCDLLTQLRKGTQVPYAIVADALEENGYPKLAAVVRAYRHPVMVLSRELTERCEPCGGIGTVTHYTTYYCAPSTATATLHPWLSTATSSSSSWGMNKVETPCRACHGRGWQIKGVQ